MACHDLLFSGRNPLESYRLRDENAVTSVTFTSTNATTLRAAFFWKQDKNIALPISRESYEEAIL